MLKDRERHPNDAVFHPSHLACAGTPQQGGAGGLSPSDGTPSEEVPFGGGGGGGWTALQTKVLWAHTVHISQQVGCLS